MALEEERAELVARYLVVGDRPSQAAVAVPSLLARGNPVVAAFERYIRDHLAEPVQIEDAASAIGVSGRTLQRATLSTLGISPIRFVQEVRLEQDAGTLRSLVRRRRHTTLAVLRRA